ncbi:aldehyde dehydrogenase family protein [Bacillus horti]|uniref:Acyl-CoA reductase-like NAD-dependent aldehyde dehydrogenase n=1 Tax=Caldalkalibacillus horti TaxID=77523 RepID=A0ABT9W580_9BACI|nr:aldehyde dehydrogenase family protein [Bacillus horti]MDQ0168418.1 acyl-CoA reductase-like NAD-dependent aldehyde dehydrogenase [Bacillus horti]
MIQRGLIIGSEEIRTEEVFSVYNKFSNEKLAQIAKAEEKHVDLAVQVAKETFHHDALSPYERYEILNKAALLLQKRKEEIAKTLVAEVGKTIKEARIEVDRSVQTMLLSSEEAKRLGGEVLPLSASPGSENKFGYYVRSPIGVICAITPFNVPLNLSCHKIGPALAAGNTVVWKPASDTPLSAYILMDTLLEAGLPAGYVNLICGSGASLGKWLLQDQRIGKYTFTGSSGVGKKMKEQSGFRSVSLELGNNSPNIVHHDADLDQAAQMCTLRGFFSAGQACISVQRIYVQRDVKDKFLEKLVEYTNKLKLGDPFDEETDIGPLISVGEANRVKEWIDEAVGQGAKIVVGGQQDGAFIEPTILENVKAEMKVVCQEVFGPVLTVIPYDELDDAIRQANDSEYGLQSGIFTSNLNHAMYAAKKLQTGGVIINDASTYRADLMPYGGIKNSGIGREGPRFAIEQMTELKVVVMNL